MYRLEIYELFQTVLKSYCFNKSLLFMKRSNFSFFRCLMPHFLERNSGTFALMSSTAGKAGVPYSGAYTGSKHALHVSFLLSIFYLSIF